MVESFVQVMLKWVADLQSYDWADTRPAGTVYAGRRRHQNSIYVACRAYFKYVVIGLAAHISNASPFVLQIPEQNLDRPHPWRATGILSCLSHRNERLRRTATYMQWPILSACGLCEAIVIVRTLLQSECN